MQDVLTDLKSKLERTIEWFRGEISSLRTGRATPALVEDLEVEYYGSKSPLKHIASISTPDSRTIVIQPWDKNALQAIGKAIEHSSLNMNPIADKEIIRLALPALTEERRKDLIKILNTKWEEARVRSRRERDEAWREVQDREKEKKISEDEKFRAKDELQKRVDEFNATLEDVRSKKEQEIAA